MISIYNEAIIKELNPYLWKELEKIEDEEKDKIVDKVREIPTQSGDATLIYKVEQQEKYLHSRYEPQYEAKKLVDSCADIVDGDNIVVFGLGLGYHIRELIKRYPESRYYIIEPNIDILHHYLNHYELKDFGVNNIFGISCNLDEIEEKIPDMISKYPANVKIVWLRTYQDLLTEDFEKFKVILPQALRKARDIEIFWSFAQIRLIENEMENMQDVLDDPDILDCDLDSLKGKTALLVAAGPSLDDEIENIRTIKEKGMAYIFPVGSAVNALLSHGIHGDAVFSYDPTDKNARVLQRIKDENITDIPMIYGPGIGYETLWDYPSKKMRAFIRSNYVTHFFLKYLEDEKLSFNSGPSIASLGLDVLLYIGFENVILVGQNLGITAGKAYSSGISYVPSEIKENSQYSEKEKDVHGNWMQTSTVYLHMRDSLQAIIKVSAKNTKVWNATKFGLHIEGAEFKPLDELMQDMTENSVNTDWQKPRGKIKIDTKYMQSQVDLIKMEKKEVEKQVKNMQGYIKEIKKNGELKLFKKLRPFYTKLNLNLKRLETNKYSGLIVMPSMIQEYRILIDQIDYFNSIKDQTEQYQKIYEEFKNFVDLFEKRLELMEEKYKKMIQVLENYLVEHKEKEDDIKN